MRKIGLALAALMMAGVLSPMASAQTDAEKQKLRKELIRKIDQRLRKLRSELIRDVDRALGTTGKTAPTKKHHTKRTPTSNERGFLGVSVRELKPGMRELLGVPKGAGVLIDEVVPRSAAHVAGLRRTDVLLAWNRTRIASERDLAGVARKGRAGQTVKLTVLRQSKKMVVEATLTARGVPAKGTPKKTAKKTDLNKALEDAMRGGGGMDPERLQKMMEQFQQDPEMAKQLQEAMKRFQEMMKDPEQMKRMQKMMQDMMGGQGNPEEMQKRLQEMLGGKKDGSKGTKKGKKDDIDKMLDDLLGKDGKKKQPTKKAPVKKSNKGFLGVTIRPLDETMRTQLNLEAGEGVLIDSVVEGSAAAKAGLKRFDVLVGVGKAKIGSIDDIRKHLGGKDAGTKLKLTIVRKGKRSTVTATLMPRPEEGWK